MASSRDRTDVGIPRIRSPFFTCSPSNLIKYAAVDPVPNPTTCPSLTYCKLARAAASFSESFAICPFAVFVNNRVFLVFLEEQLFALPVEERPFRATIELPNSNRALAPVPLHVITGGTPGKQDFPSASLPSLAK